VALFAAKEAEAVVKAIKYAVVISGVMATVTIAITLDTRLAMYRNGCFWELMWPPFASGWRVPYPIHATIRYIALSSPVIFLFASIFASILKMQRYLKKSD